MSEEEARHLGRRRGDEDSKVCGKVWVWVVLDCIFLLGGIQIVRREYYCFVSDCKNAHAQQMILRHTNNSHYASVRAHAQLLLK